MGMNVPQYYLLYHLLMKHTGKQKRLGRFIYLYLKILSQGNLYTTLIVWNLSRKVRSCFQISCLVMYGLRQWIVQEIIPSVLMRPFPLWYFVILRKKLMITGNSFQQYLNLSNVAG